MKTMLLLIMYEVIFSVEVPSLKYRSHVSGLKNYKFSVTECRCIKGISLYLFYLTIVTRNNIVWKHVCGYCLCYSKTFLLVLDSTECTKIFVTEKCSTFVPPKIKSYYMSKENHQ